MKVLLVDDSRLARLELATQLKKIDGLKICGEAENAQQALTLIKDEAPDLLLLDIHMPGENGFELLDQLAKLPIIIFTTAYPEHSLQSFDYGVTDFLLKPITESRLRTAIDRARERFQAKKRDGDLNQGEKPLFFKDGRKTWFVAPERIERLEADGNYTRIFFDDERPLIYISLKSIQEKLPEKIFFRANRSEIVNIRYIDGVEKNIDGGIELTLTGKHKVQVSRRKSVEFKRRWSL